MSHLLQEYHRVLYRLPASRCSRVSPGANQGLGQEGRAGQTRRWAETIPANLEPPFLPNASPHPDHPAGGRIAAESVGP